MGKTLIDNVYHLRPVARPVLPKSEKEKAEKPVRPAAKRGSKPKAKEKAAPKAKGKGKGKADNTADSEVPPKKAKK